MKISDSLKALAWEARGWLKSGTPIVQEQIQSDRLQICCDCPAFLGDGRRCAENDRFMTIQTWVATARCPVGKWEAFKPGVEWYFSRDGARELLQTICERWEGTPFWDKTGGQAKLGVGADCVSFVERALVETGAIDPIRFPRYVTHGGDDRMLALLENTLAAIPRSEVVWRKGGPGAGCQTLPGDILLCTNDKARHHLAIMGQGVDIWHCTQRNGVCKANWKDPFIMRGLHKVFRIKAR